MLNIIFPRPGDWGRFRIVSQWVDEQGAEHTQAVTQVPEAYAATMQRVVAGIVGLEQPWQAALVVPYLVRVEPEPVPEPELDEQGNAIPVPEELIPPQFEPYDVVELTVHATLEGGGRKVFTAEDYPEFRLEDAGAIEFYKYFTHKDI